MRSLRGQLRRSARLLAVWLLAGMALGVAQVLQAPPTAAAPPLEGGRQPFGSAPDTNQDPTLRHAMDEAAKKRNIDRQTKMVTESERICALAQEWMDEVNKTGNNSPSIASLKKMDEIQKLAKSVKERMRSE